MNLFYSSLYCPYRNKLATWGFFTLLSVLLSVGIAQAQTLELIATADKADVLAGESFTYTFKYKCASITANCTGVKLTATIPANAVIPTQTIGLPADVQSYTIAPDNRTITFTFKEPLIAGNTGIINVGGQGSFGAMNNSVASMTAVLSSGGVPGSTQIVNTTIHSADKFCPQITTTNGFAIDNTTSYFSRLQFAGNGYSTNGYGVQSPGPVTFEQQFPAGTIIESVSFATIDGTPTPVIPPNSYTINNTTSKLTVSLPATTLQVQSQFAPAVEVRVFVKYPSPTFSVGSSVTTNVKVTYQPDGVATPIVVTNGSTKTFVDGTTYAAPTTGSCTDNLSNTTPLVAPTTQIKTAKVVDKAALKPAEASYYTVRFGNTGNTLLTNAVFEDIIPYADITVTNIARPAFNNLAGDEVIKMFVKTVSNPTYTEVPANVNYYAPAPGEIITAIKITADKLPTGANTDNIAMGINFNFNATSTATSVQNCVTATASNSGLTPDPTSTPCASFTVLPSDPFSTLSVAKVITSIANNEYGSFYGGPINTGTTFWNFIRLTNRGGGQPLQNPVGMDLLPLGLDYNNGIVYTAGTPNADVTDIIPNYNGTGRTLVRLKWNNPMPAGAEYGFSIAVKVNSLAPAGLASSYTTDQKLYSPYTTIGGIKNTAFFTGSTASQCYRSQPSIPRSNVEATDLNDLNSNGVTSETVCYSSDYVGITSSAQLSSVKWVKGQCDTDYSKYPAFGQTIPGGTANYKLIVTNTGNAATRNIEILDILPWVGDQGVIDPTARQTQWRPNLVTPIQTPAGITVYYSTATNPCRTDYVASGPAGCTPANWSTVLPQDPTIIQSLKLDFGSKVLQPGDQIELTWDMRAPVGAPTAGEIAWNSFAFKAVRNDNNDPFLPSEPFKVGIKLKADVLGSYGDYVWLDANKNGIQDAGETGIDGVRVELHKDNGDGVTNPNSDPLVAFTSTANGGLYLFPGLEPGNYYAVFFLPPGYASTATNTTADDNDSDGTETTLNGNRLAIVPITTISAGEHDLTWDQGLYPAKAAVGNYVWFDENQNNIQDESSANGINGVIVCLYTASGTLSASTVTTNDVYGRPGYYLFDQLDPGSYYIQFKPTPDKTYTTGSGTVGGSTSDPTDSDADPATGRTATFNLVANQVDLSWDAGLIIQTGLYKLGNYVWGDVNNNGKVDAGETGINGVTVNLFNDRNNDGIPQADESITTTITGTVAGIDGIYTFDRLPEGNYIVQIPEANFTGSLKDYTSSTGNDPAPDPDNNVENDDNGSPVAGYGVISKPIALSLAAEPLDNGYTNYSVDFGFYTCTKPDYLASVVQPTCAGGKGSISIASGTIGDKVGYSIGTTYTGSYASATAVSSLSGGVIVGNIAGSTTSDLTYTIRFFNGQDICYQDVTFTIPKLNCCVAPTNVSATATPGLLAPGTTITLNATATGTTSGTTTYAWSGSGISAPVASSASAYTLAAPATDGVYTYTVVISNGVGCTATAVASVTVGACNLAATVTPGTCSSATNQYTVTGTISLTNNIAGGTATITDGTQSTTVNVPAAATSVAYSLSGLTSGTGSHTVTVSLPGCGTATATYTAPGSCTVGIALTATPGVCQSATNGYTLTGTLSLTNAPAGTAIVTDGAQSTTLTVAAGATSVPYTLSGLTSGSGSHTVTVSFAGKTTSVTYSAPAACVDYCPGNLMSNPSVEQGTFPTSTTAFAGGKRVPYSIAAPTSWKPSVAIGKGDVYWVESNQAHTGNKYVYITSTGSTSAGNEACSELSVSNIQAGKCYQLCVWVADAKADGQASGLALEVKPNNGDPVSYSLIVVPDNPAWSDASASVIPWRQYCYSIVAPPGATGFTIYLSATTDVGGPASYLVMDDVCLLECASCQKSVTVTPTACNSATNQYSISGTVSLTNATAGTMTISDGAKSTTIAIATSTTSVAYSLSGLTSGTGSHTVTVSLPGCGTATATYTAPASCTVAPCGLAMTVTPGLCESATNAYVLSGTITATNVPTSGTLTITPGAFSPRSLTLPATATASGTFSYSGLVSNGQPYTVTASYSNSACSPVSQTYTAPTSCSVAPVCSLTVTVTAGQCASATNTYSSTAVVRLTNPTAGTLTITDGAQSVTFVTTAASSGTFTAVFSGLLSNGSTHTVTASLPDCSSTTTTYTAPASCSVAPVCSLSATVTAGTCASATNTYSATAIVTVQHPSAGGTVTVSLGGQSIPFSTTANAQNTFTAMFDGLTSDGAAHLVTVTLPGCGTTTATYTAPVSCSVAPPCQLLVPVVSNASCPTVNNTYSSTVVVTVNNPLGGQSLTITDGALSQVFTTTAASANTFTMVFSGIAANGANRTVTATISGCGSTSAAYTAPAALTATLSSATICRGQSATLTATGGTSYTFTGGITNTTGTLVVSPAATSTYSVTVANASGCTSTTSAMVTVTPVPTIQVNGVAASCTGATPNNDARLVLLGSTDASSYNVSEGSSYNASAALFATKQTLPAVGGALMSGQANPTQAPGRSYTVRVYSATDCYSDVAVVIPPAQCQCPPAKCLPIIVTKK
ncbi:SdrD B-like domain-containing protein [Fibrella sp. WM1]|uniref:SdrD B-like domain-containing protein n=1 Tax=Fibrella musci TaxID=3242485 RepID=UPI003521E260